jgi:putative addiction module component (TIGR02574 family)
MLTKEWHKKAMSLEPVDKIRLVEMLLESIDQPDPSIEQAWVKEAETRYAAYKKGKVKAIPYATVMKRLCGKK